MVMRRGPKPCYRGNSVGNPVLRDPVDWVRRGGPVLCGLGRRVTQFTAWATPPGKQYMLTSPGRPRGGGWKTLVSPPSGATKRVSVVPKGGGAASRTLPVGPARWESGGVCPFCRCRPRLHMTCMLGSDGRGWSALILSIALPSVIQAYLGEAGWTRNDDVVPGPVTKVTRWATPSSATQLRG